MATTVPMLAPDGTSGDIPQARVQDAINARFKPAVPMTSPDGKAGYIPQDRMPDAMKAGFVPAAWTDNAKGEGTYGVKTPAGNTVQVPYSAVPIAQNFRGYALTDADAKRFHDDSAADPHAPTYWNALTNPVGSGGREQGVVGGATQFGGQAIKAMLQPVLHPIDTAKAVAKVGFDAARGDPLALGEDIVGPLVQNYMQDKSAGGHALALENLGGQIAGGIEGGRLMTPPIIEAAKVAVPAAGNAVSRALLLGKTPEAAYESALKPSVTLSQPERAAIVQTGLKNEIPVSKQGLADIGEAIDNLNNQIKNTIAADPNRPIDPNAVAIRADLAKTKFANQVNAQPDLDAIEASKQQFLAEQGARPGAPATPPRPTGVLDAQGNPVMDAGAPATPPQPAPPMGAADAQAMKQGTYRVLAGKYGEQGSASVEAQKALARGLKEEIATQFPEISNLNADESRLLDLQPVLERAVNRIANHQLAGIGTPIAATAGQAVTGSAGVGVVAGALKMVLDNPMVKSRLAIALSKGAKIPVAQALGRLQNYSGSLGAAAGATASTSGDQTASQK